MPSVLRGLHTTHSTACCLALFLISCITVGVVLVEVGDGGCSGVEQQIFYSNLKFNHKRSVDDTNRQPIKLNYHTTES